MPAEFGTSSRRRTRVTTSAITELGFALFVTESRAHREGLTVPPWLTRMGVERPELRQRILDFWQHPDYEEWGELLLLAWRGEALLVEDPTHFFERLDELAASEFDVPELPTEPPEVRGIISERLRRLRESPEMRRAYASLLRDLWAVLEPEWRAGGRALAESVARRVQQQLAEGKAPRDVVPPGCLTWRADFGSLVDVAASRGELVIAPLGLVDEGKYFFALPGVLLVGFGPGSAGTVERGRQRAERAAARFKVLSDPTRLTLLAFLLMDPSSISQLAQVLDLSQPTVSVHMKMLREAALVESERRGAQTIYRVRGETLRRFVDEGLAEVLGPRAGTDSAGQ